MVGKRLSSLVLLVLLAIFGYLAYPEIQDYLERDQRQKQAEARQEVVRQQAAARQAEAANARKLPYPDFDIAQVSKAYPRATSAWRSNEKAFYESILSKGRFDVLVIPFQVQQQAFARDIRSLMTAQLAMAIGDAAKVAIPDPYLVARALGDGERRFEMEEVFRTANKIGAKRIVAGYVGHDRKNTMRITLHVYDRNEGELFSPAQFGARPGRNPDQLIASDRLKSEHFEQLVYSKESTPIDIFQATLPKMLKFLGWDTAQLAADKPVSRWDAATLPRSPLAVVSAAAEPARDAYFLQLMAALAPEGADRERERLIEKSMLAVLRMSSESPDYRILKARGLMYMGLRPAALHALGTPASAEEKHVFAVLNGNLPEVRSNRPAVPAGMRALLAMLEENVIAATYDPNSKGSMKDLAAVQLPGDVWPYLVRRAATDLDVWTQHDNLELKAVLDRELPVEGFTAESLVNGAAALGDGSKFLGAVNHSVLNHVRKYIEASAAQSCCAPLVARFTQRDFLDLAEGIGTDNLTRHARFLAEIQGRPEAASRFLATMDSTYKDHPEFTLVRAMTELRLARNASGAEQENLLKSAYTDAFNAWYWEQGQTRAAMSAAVFVSDSRRRDFGFFHDAYAEDYPYRPFYTFSQIGADRLGPERSAREALDNSCFELNPVAYLVSSLGNEKRWNELDELFKSLDGRFNGHPEHTKLLAQSSLRKGDRKAAEKYYTEGIRLQPQAKDLYTGLGHLLFENGAQEQAARVFTSYPGLKNRNINPVALSNYAYEAGSLYYWSGDFKHALPLYRIAAELNTGSAASIASATRLAMLNGDYATAIRGSLARAQRYNTPHAYRDYLGLLHAMGFSKEAWDGFSTMIRDVDAPQVWETALVGHRLEGKSEADIAAWVAQEPMRSAGRDIAFGPMYLLRAGVTDRIPSSDLPARIAALERPVWQIEDQLRRVVRANGDGSLQHVLGPPSTNLGKLPSRLFDQSKKTKVKSDLVYYAEAYASIRRGKFDEARSALQEASSLYDLRAEFLGYLIPAYAYAAARSKNVSALEELLSGFALGDQRFDYYLAEAIVAALAGKQDESVQYLNLALVRRPFTEYRPIYTDYQYAEVCEWLYEATHDARYRTIALDWAKKNQAFNPWFAWPYAIEARFSTNPDQRARAIAMAHYLDRKSERLGKLPKEEVAKAVKEYEKRNPFRRARDTAPRQPA